MANKRYFKKYVENISSGFINNMLEASYFVKELDREKADKAMVMLLKGCEDAILKANIKFDKTAKAFENEAAYRKAKAQFYKNLFKKSSEDFGKALKDSLAEFNSAFSEEQKASLKEAASK